MLMSTTIDTISAFVPEVNLHNFSFLLEEQLRNKFSGMPDTEKARYEIEQFIKRYCSNFGRQLVGEGKIYRAFQNEFEEFIIHLCSNGLTIK